MPDTITMSFDMRICYDSRKIGGDFPACCENLDCDAERKRKPLHLCEMVKLNGSKVWVSNFMSMAGGDFGLIPLIFTRENREYLKGVVCETKNEG